MDTAREWNRIERKHGVVIPPEVRLILEGDYKGEDDFWGCVEDRVAQEAPICRAIVQASINSGRIRIPVPKKPTGKRYPKAFERQSYLARFVHLRSLELDHGARFKWGELAKAWNREHPYNLMTPAVLKRNYWNAVQHPDVQAEVTAAIAGREMGCLMPTTYEAFIEHCLLMGVPPSDAEALWQWDSRVKGKKTVVLPADHQGFIEALLSQGVPQTAAEALWRAHRSGKPDKGAQP